MKKKSRSWRQMHLRVVCSIDGLGSLLDGIYRDYWFGKRSREMYKVILRYEMQKLNESIQMLRQGCEEKVYGSITIIVAEKTLDLIEGLYKTLSEDFLPILDSGDKVHFVCGYLESKLGFYCDKFNQVEKSGRWRLVEGPYFRNNVIESEELASLMPDLSTLIRKLSKTRPSPTFCIRARGIYDLYIHLRRWHGEIESELANAISNAFIRVIKRERNTERNDYLRGLLSSFSVFSDWFDTTLAPCRPAKSMKKMPLQFQQRYAAIAI